MRDAHHPNRPGHVVEGPLVVGVEEHLLRSGPARRSRRARSRPRGRTRSTATRAAACCMLCVTITIVTCSRSSSIVSSMRRVDVGSSAEHGSSMSSTSGCTASARAMHSRCCWPPESAPPGVAEPVLHLVPEPGPLEAASCTVSCASLRDEPLAAELEAGDDVLGDRHRRERVRLLEHHADAAADVGDEQVGAVDVDAVDADRARRATRSARARACGSGSAGTSTCRSPTDRSAT